MLARTVFAMLCAAAFVLLPASSRAQAPHFAASKAHPMLIVDGAPFRVRGAQANNSSN